MSTRVSNLIYDAREETKNLDNSDTSGITDSVFLRHLNDAHERLFALITHSHPAVFDKTIDVEMVPSVAKYKLPVDCFMDNKISDLKYTSLQLQNIWSRIYLATIKKDVSQITGVPTEYYRQTGSIILMPPPQNGGTLRMTYTAKNPTLDIRRALISSFVLDAPTRKITSLILNTNAIVDITALNRENRFCVCDDDGNILMSDIKFDSINPSTGEVDVNSNFTYKVGETLEIGASVTSGSYSSTHLHMNNYVKRYLVAYTSSMIMKREFSQEMPNQAQILASMEDEIVSSYVAIVDDNFVIPDILSDDSEWS